MPIIFIFLKRISLPHKLIGLDAGEDYKNIIRPIKSRMMRCTGHVEGMGS